MTDAPLSVATNTDGGHEKRLTHLIGWLKGRGYLKALEALTLARQYHTGLRKDGVTPEFAHQVFIVSYLITLLPHVEHPEEALIAALLHDLPEDYDYSFERLNEQFGYVAADAIFALTKVHRGVKKDPAEVQRLQQQNAIASVVKGIDRIHNHQTMTGVFSPAKIDEYIAETVTWIIPMIKVARGNFPGQDGAYQNVKAVLWAQIELLRAARSGIAAA